MISLNRYKLSNGLMIIVNERPYGKTVHCGILINQGVKDENSGNNGISHFLEHLLFRNDDYVSKKILSLEVEGGVLNASVGKEISKYEFIAEKESFHKGIETLSSLILSPYFDYRSVENEKKVIIEEESLHQNSNGIIYELLCNAMWGDYSIGQFVIGRPDTIKLFGINDIQKIYEERYAPDNSIMVVSGNIDSGDVCELTERYIGAWKKNDIKN